MFTGIIECFGKIVRIEKKSENLSLYIDSPITPELKIDQSLSHNGVCLTVVGIKKTIYNVIAIKETCEKTNLRLLKIGDIINLERAIKVGDRLDGHIVQGHIDQIGVCSKIIEQGGSWIFSFKYDPKSQNITINKGSITINGVSLTIVNSNKSSFSVAIIPYTYKNTNFHLISKGSHVNLEFDILGKFFQKRMNLFLNK